MVVPSGTVFTMPERKSEKSEQESEEESWEEIRERLKAELEKYETLPNIIEILETYMKDEAKHCAQLFIYRAHQLGLELGLEAAEKAIEKALTLI